MGNSGWFGALVGIFTIVAGVIAIAELLTPKCPTCGSKLVIINNYYFCNRCKIYVNQRSK